MLNVLDHASRKVILRLFISVWFLGIFQVLVDSTFAQAVQILDRNKPSVYLAYDSRVEGKSENRVNSRFIVLQLRNNTNVNINVSANFDSRLALSIEDGTFELPDGSSGSLLKSGSEVELCYDAEGLFVQKGYSIPRKKKDPVVTDLRNSCSYRYDGKSVDSPYSMGFWIRSKEFIRFRIPANLLSESLKAYTEFSYPWEFEKSRILRNEPRHRVYFFYFDVPN